MAAGIVRPPLEDVEAIRMFLQEEGIALGAHLLDAPCGIGRRAIGLAESGYEITAIDTNEIGIAAAKERIPAAIANRLHLGSPPRRDARTSRGHPVRRNPLLGPRAGSGVHGGRCRLPSSPRGSCSPRREADLGLLEPRLLRIPTAAVRVPHDRLAGATRVPIVRPGDQRAAIGVEIL